MNLAKKFLSVFEAKHKATLLMLILFVVFLAAIQASGVGAILPVVTLLVKPDLILNHPLGARAYEFLHVSSVGEFTLALLIGYCLIYITIQISSSLLNYLQYRFVNSFQLDISTRMLKGYLANDYLFFLRHNTAVLLKNITQESRTFTCTLTFNLLKLFSNMLILAAIGLFLLFVAPMATLAAALAGGLLYLILVKGLQKKMLRWAVKRDEKLGRLNLVAHQALTGAKEIKIWGCEDKFIGDYYAEAYPYEKLNTVYHTINSCLPLWMNTVVFGGGVGILAIMQWQGLDITTYLPLLAMIGVGFSRVLPLVTNILNAFMTIRYYWKSFHNVIDAMNDLGDESCQAAQEAADGELPRMAREVVLENIRFRYPGVEEDAIHGISLKVEKGGKVALVGESGAGKSTAMDLIMGLLEPASGNMAMDGQSINAGNLKGWRRQIGYVPQQTYILDDTLRANIAFGVPPEEIDDQRVREVVKAANIENVVNKLDKGLDTRLGERGARLSGGESQRVGIARALYRNPGILILDEPTSSLDPVIEQRIINEMLMLKDITVIIVSHRIASVKFCDSIAVFDQGTIVCRGDYDSLVENCPRFREMAGAWG